jgi:serine/threonine-protein kinase
VEFKKLGRYDIVRVLGKGAMGVVYEARDPNLDRPVAIKTIRVQGLSADAASEYEVRFRTEARSAARLHHPNIVSVFDSGQDGDDAYLVMEYIQGEDLKHHLECGARFSVRSSIVMVHDLLMALDHAHRQNVVHRDIKPANMLIEVSGRVKLADFGVARIQEADETHLTQVGGAVGTPKYMSPEQAKGLRGDSRSDVFSAGVVLYELLTGRLPFNGGNQFIIIHQIVNDDPPPPSSLNPEVPVAMDAVIARGLAKNPDERYATAREFALALRGVAQQMPPSSTVPVASVTADIGRYQAGPIVTAVADAALRDGSSTGIFGPEADAALMSTVNHEAEHTAWNAIQNATEPAAFVDFLARFPAGIYTRRAQRELDLLVARSQHDMDSTVGSFAATLPMHRGVEATQQPKVPEVSLVSPPVPRSGSKAWWVVGVLSAVTAVTAVLVLRPAPAPQSPTQVASAPAEEFIEPTPTAKPALQPPAVVEQPQVHTSQAPLPAKIASSPHTPVVQGASAPRPMKPKAATAAVAQQAPPAPMPARRDEVTDTPAAPPIGQVRPAGRRGAGPSQPGQVCADKMFVLRIPCVAEQCATDRYKSTPECLEFREMERAREEQRAGRRLGQ